MEKKYSNKKFLIGLSLVITVSAVLMAFQDSSKIKSQHKKVLIDTVPKNNEIDIHLQPQDIDKIVNKSLESVQKNLDAIDWNKMSADIQQSLKNIDFNKIQLDIDRSMKNIDWQKINYDIDKSMKNIDWQKINSDIDRSMKEIDKEKIRADIDKAMTEVRKNLNSEEFKQSINAAKNVNMDQLKKEMENLKLEMQNLRSELESKKTK